MNVVYLDTVGVYGIVLGDSGNHILVQYALDGMDYVGRFYDNDLAYITEDDLEDDLI